MGTGKSPGSSGKSAPSNPVPPQITVTVGNTPKNPVALTDQDATDLRNAQHDLYDASTAAAVKMYISNTDFDKDGHSLSQTMNYLEANGVDLQTADLAQINKQFGLHLSASDLASMQYTSAYMDRAVHPIGKDVILQRGAHAGQLQRSFGITNYSNMTQAQLQQALVGQEFVTTSYMSTSYDVSKNPFLSSSSGVSGGREVVYNIKAGANTKMIFGAKAQAEIVLAKGTRFRVTGVQYTGKTATPRGGRPVPQIQIDIETF